MKLKENFRVITVLLCNNDVPLRILQTSYFSNFVIDIIIIKFPYFIQDESCIMYVIKEDSEHLLRLVFFWLP